MNPVGQPHVISSPEVVREIIAGLNSAGVKPKEIVVYDRYRKQFFGAGKITRRSNRRSKDTIAIITWTWR